MFHWCRQLEYEYPLLVQFIPSIGKTDSGTDIFAMKISALPPDVEKPQFWFHSGDHAREWIGNEKPKCIYKYTIYSNSLFKMLRTRNDTIFGQYTFTNIRDQPASNIHSLKL